MWQKRRLRDRYEVVIVGGGVHGLSTAYYLAKLGVRDVAVLDKGYLGGGASARTTAIIRANYLTPEGVPFFKESVELYEGLAKELNFNLLFNQMGRLDLGHNETAVYGLRMRTEINRLLGVDSRMIGPREIKKPRPGHGHAKRKALPHSGCPLPSALRSNSPRRGGLGIRPRRQQLRGRVASVYGSNRNRQDQRPCDRRRDGPGSGQGQYGGERHRRMDLHLRPNGGPGLANFDPSAASNGHRTAKSLSWTRPSRPPICTHTSTRPTVARWSLAVVSILTRATATAPRCSRWKSLRPTRWRCFRA